MLVGFDTAMFSSTSNSASPCHCHRSFNILVYARVNRISIGIRTCPPNLEKILQLKVYWKTRWNIGVLSPLQKLNPGIDEVLRTIPLIWPDDSASAGNQTRIQVDSFQGGSKANVSFGFGRFGTPSSSRFRREHSEIQTQRLKNTSIWWGSREASANGYFLQAWARNLPELWFHRFRKSMQLHSKFIYSHESHESTESNVFSCKSPTRCMVAVVQDLKSCQRATSFNVAGWVQSNVTSLSWDHQKRPLISLVFVFFITWVGNLRRQALSDIEYISSHHQKKSRLFKTQTWRQPFDSREVSKRFPSM